MSAIREMKIGTKLLGSFLVVIVIFAAAIGYQIFKLHQLGDMQDENAVHANEAIRIEEVQVHLEELYGMVADTIINQNIEEIKKEFGEDKKRALEDIEAVKKAADTDREKELSDKFGRLYSEYLTIFENQLMPLLQKGEKAESANVKALDEKIDKIRNEAAGHLEEIGKSLKKEMKDTDEAFDRAEKNALMVAIVLSVIAIVTGIVIALFITKEIKQDLGGEPKYIVSVTEKVAAGDLTMQFSNNGAKETGIYAAVKQMTEQLREIMRNIGSASDSMASASEELSASSEQMSRGVEEQANRSSQIATSATEMSQTVIDIAKNASAISSSANEAAQIAQTGATVVERSITEVKEISDTVDESAKLITTLGERSVQIGNIVNVIKDIADQTNLLALNAAIEAARAGEQGRGFAVVADEVRKLAERTAKATSEISGMIGMIQSEVGKAVESMDNASTKVEKGVEDVTMAGESLKKIVDSVAGLQNMIQQIATATEEISSVTEAVTGDIEAVARVSQETSASSHQVAQSASDLARISSDMHGIVGKFKV